MPEPRYSVQEWVAIEVPFADELAAFRRGGAEGIGLSFFTGPRAPRPKLAEMSQLIEDSGLVTTACWPEIPSILPIPGFAGPTDPQERTARMVEFVREVAVLNPEFIGCVTGPAGDLEPVRARAAVVDGLGRAARAAADLGVEVVIEPIHPSNADVFSIVSSLSDVAELIDEVGERNVGMVFDLWHSCSEPDLLTEIERHHEKIKLVHLSDWREPTRSWCDRALPGDGVADVAGMLGTLDSIGYSGWFELEVLSDDGTYEEDYEDSLWHLDPEELVARGRERFAAAWRTRRTSEKGRA
jgi:sugar phosphate isomerase/epimerase